MGLPRFFLGCVNDRVRHVQHTRNTEASHHFNVHLPRATVAQGGPGAVVARRPLPRLRFLRAAHMEALVVHDAFDNTGRESVSCDQVEPTITDELGAYETARQVCRKSLAGTGRPAAASPWTHALSPLQR